MAAPVTPPVVDIATLIAAPEAVEHVSPDAIPILLAQLAALQAALTARLLRPNSGAPSARAGAPSVPQSRAAAPSRSCAEVPSAPAPGTGHEVTVREFCRRHPAYTEASLRWQLFNRDTNGLAAAVVYKSARRILIDDARFLALRAQWSDHHAGPPTGAVSVSSSPPASPRTRRRTRERHRSTPAGRKAPSMAMRTPGRSSSRPR